MPLQEGSGALSAYNAARRDRLGLGARDWLVSRAANVVLALASREYRGLLHEAIHRGLLELAVREGKVAPPFTEPLDDPYAVCANCGATKEDPPYA